MVIFCDKRVSRPPPTFVTKKCFFKASLILLTICEILTEGNGEDEIEDYEHLRGRPRYFSEYPLCRAWACSPEHCES